MPVSGFRECGIDMALPLSGDRERGPGPFDMGQARKRQAVRGLPWSEKSAECLRGLERAAAAEHDHQAGGTDGEGGGKLGNRRGRGGMTEGGRGDGLNRRGGSRLSRQNGEG